MKNKKKILLIITGSIAAYKAMDLVRLLVKKSFDVRCVLTKGALEFITPLLAASLSNNKAYSDLFSHDDEVEMGHIQLSRQADLIVVAPASADFIAKIANGYADDLASSVILAANKKIFVAPAMNEKMWLAAPTQANLSKLQNNEITIIEPENDMLACGEIGVGKLAAPEKICEKIEDFFANQNLFAGKKILLTGGSTVEAIDPVRFIGNHSSGKQAIAIAKILSEMGADVTFIAGNISLAIPLKNEKIIRVKSADEMFEAVKKNLAGSDVFVACAAVADFKVKNVAKQKIKKTGAENLTLELVQNPDILGFVGNAKSRPKMIIGFAAESEKLEEFGLQKLQKKNCDLIVANNIENGAIFGSNQTSGIFIEAKKTEKFSQISKDELAKILAEKIIKKLAKI
jgi:phosphopantothenoylcysteine decarboxylase/phosphopantothenate--cysteine ligase